MLEQKPSPLVLAEGPEEGMLDVPDDGRPRGKRVELRQEAGLLHLEFPGFHDPELRGGGGAGPEGGVVVGQALEDPAEEGGKAGFHGQFPGGHAHGPGAVGQHLRGVHAAPLGGGGGLQGLEPVQQAGLDTVLEEVLHGVASRRS